LPISINVVLFDGVLSCGYASVYSISRIALLRRRRRRRQSREPTIARAISGTPTQAPTPAPMPVQSFSSGPAEPDVPVADVAYAIGPVVMNTLVSGPSLMVVKVAAGPAVLNPAADDPAAEVTSEPSEYTIVAVDDAIPGWNVVAPTEPVVEK
jgi:hypothetical protein